MSTKYGTSRKGNVGEPLLTLIDFFPLCKGLRIRIFEKIHLHLERGERVIGEFDARGLGFGRAGGVASIQQAANFRQFFGFQRRRWPKPLPAHSGTLTHVSSM